MDGRKIIQRYEELRKERRHYEDEWEEAARYFAPGRRGFTYENNDYNRKIGPIGLYSSDPVQAANSLKAGLYGTLANQATKWMSLTIPDKDLADRKDVKIWLETASARVLASFRPAVSSFYPKAVQVFGDDVIFGNACSYDELHPTKERIIDTTIPLGEVVVAFDAADELTEVIRRYRMTAQKAATVFGTEKFPPNLIRAIDENKTTEFVFYHQVVSNDDWRPGMIGHRGKAFLSTYLCEEGSAPILRHSGYDEMPFQYPRWDVDAGETYGRGVAYVATPSARVLNLMSAANLEAGERAARPTILAPDRRALGYAVKPNPGTVLYGAMVGGQAQIQTFSPNRETGLSLEMAQQKVDEIRDSFYWSLMTMVGRTGMTATEVLERNAEKLRLMSPHLGNIQTEFLAPKVARRFSLLMRAGQIPPPPDGLSGQSLDIEYQSAAALAAKSAEGAATAGFLQDIGPLAEAKPGVLDRIDENAVAEALAEARGVPAKVLRSREEAEQLAQQRAEQEQLATTTATAQAGAGIVKDLAGAIPAPANAA